MITAFIVLLILFALIGIAFKITGVLIKAIFWACILLPVGLALCGAGIACCCTLILIPVGILLLKAGAHVIIPG